MIENGVPRFYLIEQCKNNLINKDLDKHIHAKTSDKSV